MKIIINIPDSSTCLGIFVNFKNTKLESTIITTNALFEVKDKKIINILEDGTIEKIETED